MATEKQQNRRLRLRLDGAEFTLRLPIAALDYLGVGADATFDVDAVTVSEEGIEWELNTTDNAGVFSWRPNPVSEWVQEFRRYREDMRIGAEIGRISGLLLAGPLLSRFFGVRKQIDDKQGAGRPRRGVERLDDRDTFLSEVAITVGATGAGVVEAIKSAQQSDPRRFARLFSSSSSDNRLGAARRAYYRHIRVIDR